MKSLLLIALMALSLQSYAAGDPEAGKSKAMLCSACHGVNGISPNDLWPNLKGQKKTYLVNQIKAFRDGKRADPSMAPMVANLSNQDIDDIAAYYSSMDP